MRHLLFLGLLSFSLPALGVGGAGLKRYLYLSTPDGAQPGGSEADNEQSMPAFTA